MTAANAGVLSAEVAGDPTKAGIALRQALQPFEITAATKLRFSPIRTERGYFREQFEEAWQRYLGP